MHYPKEKVASAEKAGIPLIIQARSLSTRYSNKVLQAFAESPSMLEFLLSRLKRAFPDSPIVVATTTTAADQAIEDIATKNNIACFRGNEQNVLERFVNCCKNHRFTDHIVRICSDNPFLQMGLLHELISKTMEGESEYDYVSYAVNGIPAIRTHFGFFAEVIRVSTLQTIQNKITDPVYLEHVTNYIYEQPDGESFRIRWVELPGLAAHVDSVRLTIDSKEDMANALFVYRNLEPLVGSPDISWESILALVDRHPAIKAVMQQQIRSYQK